MRSWLPLAWLTIAQASCFIEIAPLEGGGGTSSSTTTTATTTSTGAGGEGGEGGEGNPCSPGLDCVELPAGAVLVQPAEDLGCPEDLRVLRSCDACDCVRNGGGGCRLDIFLYEEPTCAQATRESLGIVDDCKPVDAPVVALDGETVGVIATVKPVGGLSCSPVNPTVQSTPRNWCEVKDKPVCGALGVCLEPSTRPCLLLADDSQCPPGFGPGELVARSAVSVACACDCAPCLEAEFELYEDASCAGSPEIHVPGLGDCTAHDLSQVGAMKDGTDSKPCTGVASPQQARARLCCAP